MSEWWGGAQVGQVRGEAQVGSGTCEGGKGAGEEHNEGDKEKKRSM